MRSASEFKPGRPVVLELSSHKHEIVFVERVEDFAVIVRRVSGAEQRVLTYQLYLSPEELLLGRARREVRQLRHRLDVARRNRQTLIARADAADRRAAVAQTDAADIRACLPEADAACADLQGLVDEAVERMRALGMETPEWLPRPTPPRRRSTKK